MSPANKFWLGIAFILFIIISIKCWIVGIILFVIFHGSLSLHYLVELGEVYNKAVEEDLKNELKNFIFMDNKTFMITHKNENIYISGLPDRFSKFFKIKREVEKIQDEFLRVFRTKDLQQLARFHRQLDIIAEGYRAQSVSF